MKKEIIEKLEKPFDKKHIKQRKGSYGRMLDYIEGDKVIERLNDVFASEWSFELSQPMVQDGHVLVKGRLTVPDYQEIDGKQVLVGHIVKEAFGGKPITKAKVDGSVMDFGSDAKAVSTDSLKKCATLLGVGLDLYGTDDKDTTDNKDEKASPVSTVDEKVSPMQLTAIKACAAKNKVTDVLSEVNRILGAKVEKLEDLTKTQASKAISALNAKQ